MSRKNVGSGIDDFLKEEGIFEEAQAQAVKEVGAWQLAEAMKKEKISRNKLAKLLQTSRTQIDLILDPKNDITLGSLQRAAAKRKRKPTAPPGAALHFRTYERAAGECGPELNSGTVEVCEP